MECCDALGHVSFNSANCGTTCASAEKLEVHGGGSGIVLTQECSSV